MWKYSLLFILIASPALAQHQVPASCIELAQREGYSTEYLTDGELKKAKRRLSWLRIRHPFDPVVKKCQAAVDEIRRMQKQGL